MTKLHMVRKTEGEKREREREKKRKRKSEKVWQTNMMTTINR